LRGQLDLAKQDFEEAVVMLEVLVAQLPEISSFLASTFANQARLAERQGDSKSAQELFVRAIELQAEALAITPESTVAEQELRRLREELRASSGSVQ
jgi:hypothetical protein